MTLDYNDRTDFDNAERGFVATLDPVTIKAVDGRVIFDLAPYSYLDGQRPDTVHPSLCRQVRITLSNGALIQTFDPRTKADVDLAVTLTKAQLLGLLAGGGLSGIDHTGDEAVLPRLVDLLDAPNAGFAIVTP